MNCSPFRRIRTLLLCKTIATKRKRHYPITTYPHIAVVVLHFDVFAERVFPCRQTKRRVSDRRHVLLFSRRELLAPRHLMLRGKQEIFALPRPVAHVVHEVVGQSSARIKCIVRGGTLCNRSQEDAM